MADVETPTELSPELSRAWKFAREIGPRLQYQSAGYFPNARQLSFFGLAVLDLAQSLKKLFLRANSEAVDEIVKRHSWRDMFDR